MIEYILNGSLIEGGMIEYIFNGSFIEGGMIEYIVTVGEFC